jgi:hypothetical protein
MFTKLEDLLLTQSLASVIILTFFAFLLAVRGLFRWTSSGFWTWAAFMIYFFLNPLASILWNITSYRVNLQLSDGLSRGMWIGFVSIIGMSTFFISYLFAKPHVVKWNLTGENKKLDLISKAVILTFLLVGMFTLLIYRTGVLSTNRNVEVVSGRFVGEATGYDYVAHLFVFVPIILLLLSPSKLSRPFGFFVGCSYILLRLPDAWGRWSIVSMIIAISLAVTLRKRRNWPPLIYSFVIILATAFLVVRGHTNVSSSKGFVDLLTKIPQTVGPKLASNNTDMLSFWYLDSYVKDDITGYTYGIPFINYSIFGIVPSRLFPDKYFLVDWLSAQQPPVLDIRLTNRMIGAKWSLLGSFYGSGGIIAVILLAWLAGVLCRRLDGMLNPECPLLVQATAICWMSILWMMWASQDYWVIQVIGISAIPAFILWLFAPKAKRHLTTQFNFQT